MGMFLFSAIAKVGDFNDTVLLLVSIFDFTVFQTKILLSLIILMEVLIAGLLLFEAERYVSVAAVIWGFLSFFLIVTLWLWMSGEANCGCFGTVFVTAPPVSSLKNLVLMIVFFIIRMNHRQQERVKALQP